MEYIAWWIKPCRAASMRSTCASRRDMRSPRPAVSSRPSRRGWSRAPPVLLRTCLQSWMRSARSRATSLAVAGPLMSCSPRLNSSQLTLPSPLRSMALKMSWRSLESMEALFCVILDATCGSSSRLRSSAKVKPSLLSPPLPDWLKAITKLSTYSMKCCSSSAFCDCWATEVTCSVITPVSKAIIAKAVMRVYGMKKSGIKGWRFITKVLMSPQLSRVTIWNIVSMLFCSEPKYDLILASSSDPFSPDAHSSALLPITVVTKMPAMKTTPRNSAPIQKTAYMEWTKPCTSRYSCLKCLTSRKDRNIRISRMMRSRIMKRPGPSISKGRTSSRMPATTTVSSKMFHMRSVGQVKKLHWWTYKRTAISKQKNTRNPASKASQ
mmetsp:Transcript_119626/g.333832  ORF Transcript_119626/g.333832 Transcript_119626/m.333832 type:complete len:380 (-) Transcript_119626:358-1497(-)